MKKKISAKILITQLVILCITLFIFPMKLKADEVNYPFFLYNVRHTYEEDNSYVHPFRHKYEFYIHANHEVTGRFILSITTPSGSTAHTWFCESGGEIYNNQIMDRSVGTTVFVTGQQYLKVTLMYLTDSAIDIMNVRSIQFSQTDLDGNIITTDQSLWSEAQKIEDHTFQILGAVGFVNDNLTDVRSKLQSLITLMNTTNQSLSTLLTTATNILTKVTSIDTAIQNIDNTIDTISWSNSVNYKGYSSSLNGTYTKPTSQTNIPANTYISFGTINFNALQTKDNPIYKITLPINANNIDYNLIISNTSNEETNRTAAIKYEIKSRSNLTVYFMLETPYTNWAQSNVSIYVKTATTLYTNYEPTLQYIGCNDIEYWDLLGNINQYNFYKQQIQDNKTIIDKLSELILGNTTTNNSVSENDETNNEFKQQAQQYDQIESTFQSSFSTDQQAIQNEISVNTLTSFASTAIWFVTKLNYLFDASGDMKILFTMPLLLGLALFFIGRGAKTTAPNTIERYYSSEQTANVDGVSYYRVRMTSGRHKIMHGFNRKK